MDNLALTILHSFLAVILARGRKGGLALGFSSAAPLLPTGRAQARLPLSCSESAGMTVRIARNGVRFAPESVFALIRNECSKWAVIRNEYQAGEMSIPAPAGLSGGAVFRPGALPMLTGLVTENLESTTILEAVEEIQEDAVIERSMYQKVINYGVALLLDAHDDWFVANGAAERRR